MMETYIRSVNSPKRRILLGIKIVLLLSAVLFLEQTSLSAQDNPKDVEGIELAPACSENPNEMRGWRIRNPNNFVVEIKYEILDTDLAGTSGIIILSKAGQAQERVPGEGVFEYTFIYTPTIAGDNILKIMYGNFQTLMTTSTAERCPDKNVEIFVDCMSDNGNGTLTAKFGYDNKNNKSVEIPIGVHNGFEAPSQIYNIVLPNIYKVGRNFAAFDVIFKINETLTWKLISPNGSVATVSVSAAKLGEIFECPSDLLLFAECSFNQELHRWRVFNPNAEDVEVIWEVLNQNKTGKIIASSGSSYFFTPNTGTSQTVQVKWLDGETSQVSNNQLCNPCDEDSNTPGRPLYALSNAVGQGYNHSIDIPKIFSSKDAKFTFNDYHKGFLQFYTVNINGSEKEFVRIRGTAQVTLNGGSFQGTLWDVDAVFERGAVDEPKIEVDCPGNPTTDWEIGWLMVPGNATLTQVDKPENVIRLSHKPTIRSDGSAEFGLQFGQGANGKNCNFGAAAWFDFSYTINGVSGVGNGHGDFNIDLTETCSNNTQNKSANELSLTLYPNPNNNGEVKLNFLKDKELMNTKEGFVEIEVIDGLKTVKSYRFPLDSQDTNYQLDLSDLSNGIYFIKVKTGNKVQTEKIILNR